MRARLIPSRLWAIAMAAALVFAQVTLSAFACNVAMPHAASMSAMMEAGCPEAEAMSPQLCAKACQDEPQKYESPSLDAAPPALDSWLRVRMPAPRIVSGALHGFSLAHATSPPASILYSRFLE